MLCCNLSFHFFLSNVCVDFDARMIMCEYVLLLLNVVEDFFDLIYWKWTRNVHSISEKYEFRIVYFHPQFPQGKHHTILH